MKPRQGIMLACFAAALLFYGVGSSVRGAGVLLLAGFVAEMLGWFQVGKADDSE